MFAAVRQWQRKLSNRDEGFTLVELVVAMIIIASVLMVLIGVQISAAVTINEARKREQATAIANEAIEQMRAIPWAVLNRGMYSGYLSAAGGDSHVSGGKLVTDSGSYQIKVAPVSADQKPSIQAWSPLFDSTGSNKQVVTDAAGTNTTYTVRAYVIEPLGGAVNAVGIAVYVDWKNSRGTTVSTLLLSTAYRGTGCGNEENSPFLAACQAFFDAGSSSGIVSTSVSASTTSDGINPTTQVNLLYPSSDPFYEMSMRAVNATATMTSQQVSVGSATAAWGGTTLDDNDAATQPVIEGWTDGYANNEIRVTDDYTQTDIPAHVSSTSYQQGTSAESSQVLSHGGAPVTFTGRSDYRRQATLQGSTTSSCRTGIPAGAPCTVSSVANLNTLEGAGYILMEVNGQIFRLSRRLSESGTTSNSDLAWTARFTGSAGTSAVGCASLADSGCVSAGAERQLAQFSMGAVVGGTWVNPANGQAAAANGIVVVEGASGCATGLFETVKVERGVNQKTTVPTYTRCGQMRYWNGSAYTTVSLGSTTTGAYDTGAVTYTTGGWTITATAHITVTAGGYEAEAPDPACVSDGCSVSATSGSITVDARYVVSDGTTSYTVISSTSIAGPAATATFKAAPSA